MARDIKVRVEGDSGDLVRAAAAAGIALEVLNKDADRTSTRGMANLERSLGDTGKGARQFGRLMDDATIASHKAGADILRTGRLIDETGVFLDHTTGRTHLFSGALGGLTGWLRGLGGGGGIIGTLLGGLGQLGAGIMDATQVAGDAAVVFGDWLMGLSDGVPIIGDAGIAVGGLVASIGELMPLLGPVAVLVVALGAALAVVPALAAAGTFAINFFGGAITTLAAVIVGFIPPLTLMGVLMGGLGAGFVLAGIHAHGAHKQFSGLHDTVVKIENRFHELIDTLAQRLAPAFNLIGHDVLHLITFLKTLSSMPLDQALKRFSTRGVQLISKLAGDIGHLMARPFRLIVQDAFSSSSSVKKAFESRFGELRDYLFGHAESIFVTPIHQRITRNIPGALQPIVAWFNRQHFTATGLRWLRELTRAIEHSAAWNSLWNNIKTMAGAAGTIAGHAFVAAFVAELKAIPGAIAGAIGGGGNQSGVLGLPHGVVPRRPHHRATGGTVIPNISYFVGERGPELFTPTQPGIITPHNNGAGGGGPVIHNHFHMGVIAGTDTHVQNLVRKAVISAYQMHGPNAFKATTGVRFQTQ